MGANPNNANLDLRNTAFGAHRSAFWSGQLPADYAPGREALQALLAFSSLHAQIRRRQIQQRRANPSLSPELWAADDFVLDEVLQLVTERTLTITGADGAALALSDGEQILCRASAGSLAPPAGSHLNPNSGFSGACFRTGLIVRCDDAFKDPRVDREACERMGVRSMVAIPLHTEQGIIGLLAGFCSEAYGFNDSDVRSFSLLAELILAALQPERGLPEEPEVALASPGRIVTHEVKGPAGPAAGVPSHARRPEELPSFETLRDVLTPVIEDSGHVQPQELVEPSEVKAQPDEEDEPLFAQFRETKETKSRSLSWIAILAAALVVLGSVAAVWWWRAHHSFSPATQANSVAPSPLPDSGAVTTPAGTPKEPALTQVTGLRHWSSDETTTVAIDLQDQIQYEAHRLTDPERIYFDLHDTSIAAGVANSIEVGDNLLVRIRVAQPTPGVTRVVMETKNSPNFSVSLEPNPYRLLVQIRSIAARPSHAGSVDLFAPMHRELSEEVASTAKPRQHVSSGAWLAPPAEDQPQTAHPPKFRLVLDAGHGGWDMGTVGRKGLLEKNLVLDIVARLGNLVEKKLGGDVLYTRHDDTYLSLESRTDLANRAQADFFLSVHANYSDLPSARGVETYYTNTFSEEHSRQPGLRDASVTWRNVDVREKTEESRHFATLVQQELFRTLSAKDRALRNRGVREASYVVLTGTAMPAVLAEVSFVSSPTDEMSLQSAAYRQRIAEALYRGVANYANGLRHMNLASAKSGSAGN
jgi:N-acetylmuramoyl-L-alanine amidase